MAIYVDSTPSDFIEKYKSKSKEEIDIEILYSLYMLRVKTEKVRSNTSIITTIIVIQFIAAVAYALLLISDLM